MSDWNSTPVSNVGELITNPISSSHSGVSLPIKHYNSTSIWSIANIGPPFYLIQQQPLASSACTLSCFPVNLSISHVL